jgi:glutathione synthase/RimK-type ligase-like ATP-grasp enzyme
VDLIESDDGPYVIEVNCFPGYKGVPEADRLLAEYIFDRAANPASRKALVSCVQVAEGSA